MRNMAQVSKLNVKKDKSDRTYGDIVFDSVLEMRYYIEVILPGIESGEIMSCERQVRYELQPAFFRENKKIQPIVYKADFVVRYANGEEIVVDTKGYAETDAKIKRKMFFYRYPEKNLQWIKYSKPDGGWVTYEVAQKGLAERRKKRKELKEEKEKCSGEKETCQKS